MNAGCGQNQTTTALPSARRLRIFYVFVVLGVGTRRISDVCPRLVDDTHAAAADFTTDQEIVQLSRSSRSSSSSGAAPRKSPASFVRSQQRFDLSADIWFIYVCRGRIGCTLLFRPTYDFLQEGSHARLGRGPTSLSPHNEPSALPVDPSCRRTAPRDRCRTRDGWNEVYTRLPLLIRPDKRSRESSFSSSRKSRSISLPTTAASTSRARDFGICSSATGE